MADSKVSSAREAMEGTDCSLLGVYFSHFFFIEEMHQFHHLTGLVIGSSLTRRKWHYKTNIPMLISNSKVLASTYNQEVFFLS